MSVRLDSLHAGCNRDPETADWCHDLDLVAYAAASTIVIYDPRRARCLVTLRGHNVDSPLGARVNCVRWLPAATTYPRAAATSERELVSGSADTCVAVWRFDARTRAHVRTAVLRGHERQVQALAVHCAEDGALLLSSVGGDHTVRLWRREPLPVMPDGEWVSLRSSSCVCSVFQILTLAVCVSRFLVQPPLGDSCWNWALVQTIAHPPKRIMMCAAFATFDADLPDGDADENASSASASASVTLLATAGADGSIHLMVQRRDAQFATALQLEGHQDWVRALAFARTDDGALLLASASQDFNVRLWKLATPAALAAAAARAAAASSDESGECEDELGASFGLFTGRGGGAASGAGGAGRAQRPLGEAAAQMIAEGGADTCFLFGVVFACAAFFIHGMSLSPYSFQARI
jgi:WD40 repeat protein